MDNNRKKRLQGYIGEIELWMKQKAEIQASITEIYGIAKADGFDTRAMRQAIKARQWDSKDELKAYRDLCEEYEDALGDFASTDLGRAAMDRVRRQPPGVI
jgi:uncharacterized protein (UPF0335 family)